MCRAARAAEMALQEAAAAQTRAKHEAQVAALALELDSLRSQLEAARNAEVNARQ